MSGTRVRASLCAAAARGDSRVEAVFVAGGLWGSLSPPREISATIFTCGFLGILPLNLAAAPSKTFEIANHHL